MNKNQFVQAIKKSLRDGMAHELASSYSNPPGRKPTQKTLRLSKWYHSLNPEQQKGFEEIIEYTID